jgi:uncharacterized protein YkwD
VLPALAAACAALALADPPSELTEKIRSELERRRDRVGLAPLGRDERLDALAQGRAREVARRPRGRRLSGRSAAGTRLDHTGIGPIAWADERLFLMRGVADPAADVLRRWRAAERSWRAVTSAPAPLVGFGAARARDGTLVVVALVVRLGEPPVATTPEWSAEDLRAVEAALDARVDAARRDRGLAPLEATKALARVARAHSREMARVGRIAHRGLDGSNVAERVLAAGVRFAVVSENLSLLRGHAAPAGPAVEGWLKSPGHRRNLLDPRVTHTGVGIATDGEGGLYVTQIYLRPPE